jgi:LAO/AO transport system kinase
VWQHLVRHQEGLAASGELAARRRRQQVRWTWSMVQDRLLTSLRQHPAVREVVPGLERQVLDGTLTPALAAEQILKAFSAPT